MKKAIIILLIMSLHCQGQINGNSSIISGGRIRTFSYHLPANVTACNLPLIIAFHGDGGNGAGFQSYAGLDALANSQNFIVVYPNAVSVGGTLQFNKYADNAVGFGTVGDAGFGTSPDPNAPDDVLFTSDIINYFSDSFKINRNRVYATGHSGGAFMCYFLSVALADKITAIAPVAGSLWINTAYSNSRFSVANFISIPILHIHSKGDPVVSPPIIPYPKTPNYVWPTSQFSGMACNNWGTYTTMAINVNADLLTFCGTGKKVQMIITKDATHGWPTAINPQQQIWDFVKNYSLNSFTLNSCTNTNQTIQSGSWQNTSTWLGGTLPTSTNFINIMTAHEVSLPSNLQTIINNLNLKGRLVFQNGSILRITN